MIEKLFPISAILLTLIISSSFAEIRCDLKAKMETVNYIFSGAQHSGAQQGTYANSSKRQFPTPSRCLLRSVGIPTFRKETSGQCGAPLPSLVEGITVVKMISISVSRPKITT